MPTGQPNVDIPSLRFSSRVTLSYVKLTVKINQNNPFSCALSSDLFSTCDKLSYKICCLARRPNVHICPLIFPLILFSKPRRPPASLWSLCWQCCTTGKSLGNICHDLQSLEDELLEVGGFVSKKSTNQVFKCLLNKGAGVDETFWFCVYYIPSKKTKGLLKSPFWTST